MCTPIVCRIRIMRWSRNDEQNLEMSDDFVNNGHAWWLMNNTQIAIDWYPSKWDCCIRYLPCVWFSHILHNFAWFCISLRKTAAAPIPCEHIAIHDTLSQRAFETRVHRVDRVATHHARAHNNSSTQLMALAKFHANFYFLIYFDVPINTKLIIKNRSAHSTRFIFI